MLFPHVVHDISRISSRISARITAVSPGFLTVAMAVALMALLQMLPPAWHGVLRYERGAVLDGELWRLLTAHLIHLGLAHWALNAAGLVLCALLANRVDAPGLPGWLLLPASEVCTGVTACVSVRHGEVPAR